MLAWGGTRCARLNRPRPRSLHARINPVSRGLLIVKGSASSSHATRTQAEDQHLLEELQRLVGLLPDSVKTILSEHPDLHRLVEVVMDLGRPPFARFPEGDVQLSPRLVTPEDLEQAVEQVGDFDADNRAGINQTLHRISCMRNRAGRIVGLTCRAGRVIEGSAALVEDFIKGGKSILLLGRPGVGKTTAIRDISCMLANAMAKRTVIVDTSNEIGGDGDVPHPGIGDARRMQVPRPEEQHRVMQEAVENHMPQCIIIDEIGTEAECQAARTISQRGVQLVATAHGNALENVIKNPALNLLVGGIQSVTLGDDAAKRRGVQKSVLERAGPPTFDVCVEMLERHRWRVHPNVGLAVDSILAGGEPVAQMRERDPGTGRVRNVAFKGIVRRADDSGSVQSLELWATSDGEEITRPVRPVEVQQQALPTPPASPRASSSGGSSPSGAASARTSTSSSSSSNTSSGSARAMGGSSDGGGAALSPGRPFGGSRATTSQDDTSPLLRRPLPSMLAMPEPPPSSWPSPPATPRPAPAASAATAAAVAALAATAAARKAAAAPQQAPSVLEPELGDAGPGSLPSGPDEGEAAAASQAASEAPAAWPSAAAAAASLPSIMPPPVLDTKAAAAAAAAAAASPSAAAAASAVRAAVRPVLPPNGAPARQQQQAQPAPPAAAAPTLPPPVQPLLTRAGGGVPAMRVYLLCDDDATPRIQAAIAALADSSVVAMTEDLETAHVVVATRVKLRASPKMKAAVRKLGKPIYVLRSLSATSLHRDLCPLLGLNPLAAAGAVPSEGSPSSSSSPLPPSSGGLELYDSSSSMEEDADVGSAGQVGLGGGRAQALTSADDYAALLDALVRESRYQPVDRELAGQILDSFLQELGAEGGGGGGNGDGGGGGGGAAGGGCSAASLATMAWALAHTKHKRKFVDAKRGALAALAAACEGRWGEFSSRDLLRLATGVAGLRFSPGAAFVEELAVRFRGGVAAGEFSVDAVERLSAAVFTLETLVEQVAVESGATR